MTTTGTAIVAKGIRKSYGSVQALDGFDLTVTTGTVYGLLGPNGSGKTTAVKCLTTLSGFDAGSAEIAGFDVTRQPDEVRKRIGLTGQYAAVDEILNGRENLVMFGRLYGLTARAADRRADELLEHFDLVEAAKRSVVQYSGGMRRRLDLAASLIQAPEVLFLDEPTTGLDPRSRNQVWSGVRALVKAGTTVLLTTQYLEEADQLADRIAVLDNGKVIAEGTADELKSRIGGDQIDVVLRSEDDLERAAEVLRRIGGGEPQIEPDDRKISVVVSGARIAILTEAVRALDDAGIHAEDIGVRRPTLDEVFLGLTGRRAGEPELEATSS
ncbi:ATP-binding cassette domain-containing protein [Saccharothrix deserti]|uniref:ATP-binding cassette domain-containing protein n=1 Tax=Saccharothrix deserti TaxID=2593674 RepID=UPI00131C9774|nr:ATP-binding cassette domain-containing protein [Saccharothrix deserti]